MTPSLRDATRRFRDVLERSQTFLLSGHVNIDGDSLGSMLGMCHFLRRLGKQVTALTFEPVVERYAFLDAERCTEVFEPARHGPLARDVDVFMMFDFSATSRMPGLWDHVKAGRAFKVCVDHHPAQELPGDLNLHVPTAPATGTLVLELIRACGGTIDSIIAEPLLVAISTDTGWFRYSNTNPAVLRDAAALVETGLNPNRIYREIYQRNETALIRLMGRVAAHVREELDGRLLWATIPQKWVEELGVGVFETDELLDLMRTGRDAECVALLRELENGENRVNLRSRGLIDVGGLARELGGGGHRHAAGTTLTGPLDAAAQKVVGRLKTVLGAALAEAASTGSAPPYAAS